MSQLSERLSQMGEQFFGDSYFASIERTARQLTLGMRYDESTSTPGLRQLDWVPRSVRSRAREVEKAFSNLEHELGRAPTDEELAAKLRIGEDELARWLASIAATTVGPLDRAVAAGYEPESVESSGMEHPVAAIEDRELRDIMRSEIKRLPEREKLVLSLYYDEGLTLAEIGDVLGVTESRVSQIHTKSVLHLRSRMSAAGVG